MSLSRLTIKWRRGQLSKLHKSKELVRSKHIRAGKIILKPSEETGEHIPYRREEVIIILKGNGLIIIEGKKISASTSNISCGGMYLPMPPESALQEKTGLEITLNLPSVNKPVKVMGEVNRIDGDSQGVAVEFQGLYDDNILAIERFIRSKLH